MNYLRITSGILIFFIINHKCAASIVPDHTTKPDSSTFIRMLFLDLPLVDFPFMQKAARMRSSLKANTTGTESLTISNYLGGYESPSMQQSLGLTKSLHSLNYYTSNKLWDKWIHPDTRQKLLLNRIGANLTAGAVDLVFTYYGIVFSPQWLHEEFHRNGMTMNGIPSYDETYNRFNGGVAVGSVSKVRDEDLIRWKQEAPEEMIRSFAAGTESELLLLRSLQRDHFKGAGYPYILMNMLLTKHAVDYVNQFKQPGFDSSIDSMNYYGGKIADRDFVGWDFSAWVYDLHRPDEPYSSRGIHPSGTGIDRAIKNAKLSEEERAYLSKMGKMQYLNFLSPFMAGIRHIRLSRHTSFNFATRHYLTSFGYDLNLDLLINHREKPFYISLHGYRNKYRFYPGIEFESPPVNVKEWQIQPRIMAWMQPVHQRFYDTRARTGGMFQLNVARPVGKSVNVYINAEGKTKGWVAGNPYLKSNLTVRCGIAAAFKN